VKVGDRVVLRFGLAGEIDEIREEGYEDVGGRLAEDMVIVALDEGGFMGVCWEDVRPEEVE
jgi:hypothetical protein